MTRKCKPLGWPKLMVAKRLKTGAIAYYWDVPSWAKRKNCPFRSQALGGDYGQAKQRCDEILNPQFDGWLAGASPEPAKADRPLVGTFDWLVSIYKSLPKYTRRPEKTRKSYDNALRLVSQHKLKDGRLFGSLSILSIKPATADVLFDKLRQVRAPVLDNDGRPIIGEDGKPMVRTRERARTALLAMVCCRTAWNWARRAKPEIIPSLNPFVGVDLQYTASPTRPVTHAELLRFVKAADEAGEPSIGTAAMIAFYWLQRETDIIGRLSWVQHYRPADNVQIARIYHHKTRELVEMPLYDEDGTVLWPELMERLDAAPRRGALIVMRDRLDRKRKICLPWKEDYFRHRVAKLRTGAGIDPSAKFMGLRHGGNTEGADADLTDAQLRALSGHKTASMTALYAKQTMKQRREGARKRLAARTKKPEAI
jgi:Phage integrase family